MNPFETSLNSQRLFNISNRKAASDEAEIFLLIIENNGNTLREKFISECAESRERFEKPINRIKILNFSSEAVKKSIKSGDKFKEIRMQRDLFGRMLGLSMDHNVAIVEVFERNHQPGIFPKIYGVVIVDGFYLLHTLLHLPSTFGNISKQIMQISMATKTKRVDIIFD